MATSTFRNALSFFDELGIYDVVLPFLLIFTLMFAMLEKTKVLGKEGDGSTRKNLNAMVAFVTAFLVVASSQLVYVINATVAKSMVVLVMIVLVMVLWGAFQKEGEMEAGGFYKTALMAISFFGIALILLYNLGWLQYIYDYTAGNLSGPVVGSFALLLIVLFAMWWIYKPAGTGAAEKKS